jgi:four helix bundle protein
MKKPYRDLFIWRASVDLAVQIIALTEKFPQRQRYVLADQMQRAAVSVPSNIAEGKGRHTSRELRHFLATARGSLYELDTQLEIARHAGLLEADVNFDEAIAKISAGINHFMRQL